MCSISVNYIENDAPFDVLITFTEEPVGFGDDGDIEVTGSTDPTPTTAVSTGGEYSEHRLTITPDGTKSEIKVTVPRGALTDAATNPNAPGLAEWPYGALVPTFTVPGGFTELEEIAIPISFNGVVNTLDDTDFTFVNATFEDLVGSGSLYTLTIMPVALNTDIEITLAADAVSDEAGRKSEEKTVVIPFGGEDSVDVDGMTTEYNSRVLSARVRRIMGGEDPRMLIERLDRKSRGGQAGSLDAGRVGDGFEMSFSSSVETLLHYAAFEDERHAAAEAQQLAVADGNRADGTGFDFWTRGMFARSDTADTDLDVWLVYAGLDYRFDDRFVLGVLGQVDITDQTEANDGTAFSGTGWLAGPYLAWRLHDNLLVDGRVAWGRSANEVNPLGLYTDDFDTTRWLARGQVTGSFAAGPIDVRPFVQMIYFDETQEDYTDTLGNRIPELNVAFGHVRFGPEVRGQIAAGQLSLSPFVSVSGLWEFDNSDDVVRSVALDDLVNEDVRARVDGGLSIRGGKGWSATIQAFYDGIGQDDTEAWGGSAQLRILF